MEKVRVGVVWRGFGVINGVFEGENGEAGRVVPCGIGRFSPLLSGKSLFVHREAMNRRVDEFGKIYLQSMPFVSKCGAVKWKS